MTYLTIVLGIDVGTSGVRSLAAKRTALDSIATPLPERAGGKTPVIEGDVHQIGNQIGMPEDGAARKLLN